MGVCDQDQNGTYFCCAFPWLDTIAQTVLIQQAQTMLPRAGAVPPARHSTPERCAEYCVVDADNLAYLRCEADVGQQLSYSALCIRSPSDSILTDIPSVSGAAKR